MKKERKLVVKTKSFDNIKEIILLEDEEIVEYKKDTETLVGNIYCGRVVDIVPSINASFINIGLEKNAFIKNTDFNVGDFVMVQLTSGQHKDKGASLSRRLSFVGRFCILIINQKARAYDLRLSSKIKDSKLKETLSDFASKLLEDYGDPSFRLIVRSDTKDNNLKELKKEYKSFVDDFKKIKKACKQVSGNPILLRENEGLIGDLISHYPLSSFKRIYTDNHKLSLILSKKYPSTDIETLGATGDYCILDILNLSSRLTKLLSKKVWLKSGSYIVIESTEALTAIDVNSGKHKDSRAFEVNKEAAKEIMRQLRLRNIAGIIICDFIDMKSSEDDFLLLEYMKELAKDDFQKPSNMDITKLGLVELTRKRIET